LCGGRLTAIIDAISPLYKEDETEFCGRLDDVATNLDCSVLSASARAANLYCQCQIIAASPNQIKLEWPSTDGNTVNISIVDVCETPPVPGLLADSAGVVYEPHEAALFTDPRFLAARDALVAQAEAALTIPTATAATYKASRPTILAAVQNALLSDAIAKNGDRMDLVAGGLQAGGTGAAVVAPFYVRAVDSGLNSDGITAVAGTIVVNPTADDTTLETTYNTASGSTDGPTVSHLALGLD